MKQEPSEELSEEEFAQLVRIAPLVSIDIICRDNMGRVLVLWRKREPAKDFYFVPGGRIRKNESIGRAFERILKKETHLTVGFDDARFLGVFEHVYNENRFGNAEFTTQYISLAYEIDIRSADGVEIDSDHENYTWIDGSELLSRRDVHQNVKAFFAKKEPIDNE